MKKLFLLVALLATSPAWATFTLVQHVVNSSCSTGSTCTLTVSSTGSGHVMIIGMAVPTALGKSMSSINAGCSGSWTRGANTTGSETVGGESSDALYCLNSSAGATSITVTTASGISAPWEIEIVEYSFSGASVAYDTSNNIANATSTNRGGADLTALTGSNDLLYQVMATATAAAVTVTACSGSYTGTGSSVNDLGVKYGFATAVNTTTGTAPTWTFSGNARSSGSAVAISETSSVPSIVIGGRPTLGGSIQIN